MRTLKKALSNLLLATTAFVAIAAITSAQVANISRSTVDPSSATVISSGLANAVSQTYFDNDGRTIFVVKNGNGAPITVNFIPTAMTYFLERLGLITIPTQSNSVPSGTTVVYGPFPTDRYNTANNTVQVSLSTVTNVSVTALQVPKQ